MTISINFDFTTIVEINNCNMFSTGPIISFFFDKKTYRDYAKFSLEKSGCVKSVVDGDNLDYANLPECYKLYVVPIGYYTINVKDNVISNPFSLFDQYMGEDSTLFVLLKNETNKNPIEMKILDICDENKPEWTDVKKYSDTIVMQFQEYENKMDYLLRYAMHYKF